jgi:perosamine synthetase
MMKSQTLWKNISKMGRETDSGLYFGFVEGHNHIFEPQQAELTRLVEQPDHDVVKVFEKQFAQLIGDGQCVSFAAARMAFFALMKTIGIGPGAEVVLPGTTCAVMVNAVLRIGATPIYADIDAETFGSGASGIHKCLSSRTRLIVAQHSFGIPCDVHDIAELACAHGIYLLEDCALTLDSRIGDIPVGNFGDAAIFSTDHSKPLNTFIGGLIYSRKTTLLAKIRLIRNSSEEISIQKSRVILKRILFEHKYFNPQNYRRSFLYDRVGNIISKLTPRQIISPSLNSDFNTKMMPADYNYPAQFPSFLAQLGIEELDRWPKYRKDRATLLRQLVLLFSNYGLASCYKDPHKEIIPLRFVYLDQTPPTEKKRLRQIIHTPWIWFETPIVPLKEPLENYQYTLGVCPNAERIGRGIINIPCNLSAKDMKQLIQQLRKRLL